MRVMTDSLLPSGRRLSVRLCLPPQEALHLDGQVVWAKDQDFEFTRRHVSGIEFVNVAPDTARRLHASILNHIELSKDLWDDPGAAGKPTIEDGQL